ncbi:hypothetical protein [Amorphus orientalis]|uniref:Uncharacterized protein n=1 Tax=Amorphus orientalis TaxID=649198 RepID=A0AAE3VKL3_9HYPH|nr:hypothetical protein [Amorphus orientalis]MDQ0313786.1 hypothetical protein [Amorphus orientalis]
MALLMALAALIPSLMPAAGEPVGIVVPPWSSSKAMADRVAAAGGLFLSVGDRVIVAQGGADFVRSLRAQGIFHPVRAAAATCFTRDQQS